MGSSTIRLLFCLDFSLIITFILLLLNWTEEFNNLFNTNLIESCLAITLLIKYTSILSIQRPSYRKNITKLITIKAATIKGDKVIVNIIRYFYKVKKSLNSLKVKKLKLRY